jgi:hypothetical protein
MITRALGIIVSIGLLGLSLSSAAQTPNGDEVNAGRVAKLRALVEESARKTVEKFSDKKVTADNVSITLIDLTGPAGPVQASFRGNERTYPASVSKLFYLLAVHRWLEDKKIEETPELRRAMRDMIVVSSNEATQYIVDVITQTTGGYELPPQEMAEWQYKRNAVNRYFTSLGYTNINVNQKTFCEDAYGRESVSRGKQGENRNMLTTDATARLMMEIVTGKAVTPQRSAMMMDLLKRDHATKSADSQAHDFTAPALAEIKTAGLWSKAGWTSTTRHDAAYVELPSGVKFVLVTFTTNHSGERKIIPTIARVVIDGLQKTAVAQK